MGGFRKGEEVRRRRDMLAEDVSPGEVLLSEGCLSWSRTDVRTGDVRGNPSSAGFLGVRERLGDEGLAGRS
jgi:hypothetical protein